MWSAASDGIYRLVASVVPNFRRAPHVDFAPRTGERFSGVGVRGRGLSRTITYTPSDPLPMHTRLAELMAFADRSRDELLASVAAVPAELLAVRPESDSWSVADVLVHLHLVEQGTVRLLFRAFRNAREAGLGMEQETSTLLTILDRFRLPERVSRMSAPDFTRPADACDVPTALARLAESREGLRTWAREADGYALGSVRWQHPLLGELTLYGWALMIGQHELRHAAQIRDIARSVRA